MASAKKNETAAASKGVAFDYSKYLPEGMKATDLTIVESTLVPIYSAQEAFEGGWEPACGWLDRFVILPEQRKGTKDAFIPKAIKLIVEVPTKGLKGTKDEREECDVVKGDELLVMINGQMLQNKELLAAVADEKNVYFATFRIKGTKDVDRPSEMWDYEVQIAKGHPKKREGRFAIPIGGTKIDLILGEGRTASGEVYDTKTGELINSAPAS